MLYDCLLSSALVLQSQARVRRGSINLSIYVRLAACSPQPINESHGRHESRLVDHHEQILMLLLKWKIFGRNVGDSRPILRDTNQGYPGMKQRNVTFTAPVEFFGKRPPGALSKFIG
jgi:hypothetical protein